MRTSSEKETRGVDPIELNNQKKASPGEKGEFKFYSKKFLKNRTRRGEWDAWPKNPDDPQRNLEILPSEILPKGAIRK